VLIHEAQNYILYKFTPWSIQESVKSCTTWEGPKRAVFLLDSGTTVF